jgi:heme/copper-type cytochrome/quinol oxidase subunit 4
MIKIEAAGVEFYPFRTNAGKSGTVGILPIVILILANLVTIHLAVVEQWPIATILWVYWAQSVIIGVFVFAKIKSLKEFSTEGLTINNTPVDLTPETRKNLSRLFAFNWGFAHAIYALFLGAVVSYPSEILIISMLSAIFFINHLFSFVHYKNKPQKKYNVGYLMVYPYARIIPMHLTIMFGTLVYSPDALVFFMSLKTAADVIMHVIEHRQQWV